MKGFGKKLKDQATLNAMNSPEVYAQVQKNTEKVLKNREKETLLIVKAAVKELLLEKYDELITNSILKVMDDLKKDSKEIVDESQS